MKKTILFLFIGILSTLQLLSQTPNDCVNAINICTNANFAVTPNGSGFPDFTTASNVSNPTNNPVGIIPPGGSGCLKSGELNSTWMIINIQSNGTLEFSLGAGTGPGAQSGCYDWAMWAYTPTTCTQINANTLAPVRCCWNNHCSGGTGLSSAANLPAGAFSDDFGAPLNVSCGQQYIMCFTNYSSVNTLVPLNFFGTAQVSCSSVTNPLSVSNSTICSGQTTTLTVTGASGNTYTWQPGNLNGNTITVSPASTTVYTVAATGGCATLSNTATSTVTVDNPVSTILSVSNASTPNDPTPNVQCLQGNLFNFTSANTSGTHNWNFNGASPSTSNLQNPTGINYLSSGTYTVTHTVTTNNCTSISTTTILIIAQPIIQASNNGPICSGNYISLISTGANTYSWNGPNGFTTTSQSPSFITSNLSGGQYTVTGVDSYGCSGSALTSIIISPVPTLNMTISSNKGCAPVCTNIDIQSSMGIQSVNWSFGNGTTSTTMTNNVCYNTTGIYTVNATVTSTNGCISNITNTIEVYPNPIADFVYSPARPNMSDPSVTFTNASLNTNSLTIFNWYIINTTQFSTVNATYNFSSPGTYPVTLLVTTDKGCKDTITKAIIIGEDYGIFVPNAFTPNGDGLNDTFQPKGFGVVKYELCIFDRWGEKIFQTNKFDEGWDGTRSKKHDVAYGVIEDGVYTWLINLTSVYGKSHELKGHVTLMK